MENITLTKSLRREKAAWDNFIFEWAIIFLLFFSPFAFGSVRPWAYNIIELTIFSLLFLWLRGAIKEGRLIYVNTPLLFFIPLTIVFFVMQTLPLPGALVSLLSPGAALIKRAAGVPASDGTAALYPWAAREQASFLLSVEGFFFLLINNVKRKRQIKKIIFAALASGVLLSVLALIQKTALDGVYFLPFVNKNHFAGYMEALLSVAAVFLFLGTGWRTQILAGIKSKICAVLSGPGALSSALAFGLSFFFVCAIFMTGSRGGVAGTVALFFTLAVLVGRSTKRKAFILAVAVCLISAGFMISANSYVRTRLSAVKAVFEDPAVKWRLDIWRDTFPIIRDFPVVGVGLGNFENVFPIYKKIEDDRNIFQPENDYLYLLVEGGTLGFALSAGFSTIFLKEVYSNFKKRKDPLALGMGAGCMAALSALGVHGLVDTNLHMPATLLLVTVLMGLGYVCSGFIFTETGREGAFLREKTISLRPKVARALASLGAAVFLLLAFRSATASAADLFYISALHERSAASHPAFRAGGYDGALRKLEISSLLSPGRSESIFEQGRTCCALSEYYTYGKNPDLRLARECRQRALALLDRTLNINPYSSFAHLLKGMALQKSGEASREFATAFQLNPRNGFVRSCFAMYGETLDFTRDDAFDSRKIH